MEDAAAVGPGPAARGQWAPAPAARRARRRRARGHPLARRRGGGEPQAGAGDEPPAARCAGEVRGVAMKRRPLLALLAALPAMAAARRGPPQIAVPYYRAADFV